MRQAATPFILGHLVVAGLDVGRFGWSGPVPFGVHAVGLAGYAAGFVLSAWAVRVNPFFSPVVRVQAERGHRLVSDGPYRFLRHPGYAGLLLSSACGAAALGSWWSLVPLVPVAVLFLRRTWVEDRYLRDELTGYAGYAGRVRYRLVPGLW